MTHFLPSFAIPVHSSPKLIPLHICWWMHPRSWKRSWHQQCRTQKCCQCCRGSHGGLSPHLFRWVSWRSTLQSVRDEYMIYVLKNLNKIPTFGQIDISNPRFVYPKKPWKIPLLNQPFAGEPHAACSQEPSWKPVVPKLESLAKKAQKRWRDLVQLNDAKMLGGHRTNGFIWFYVIFYLLPAIKFWKMYEAVISWYSQWVSNYLHVFLLYFSIHTYVFMLASPTCNSQFVLSFMSEKQKLRIADRADSPLSVLLLYRRPPWSMFQMPVLPEFPSKMMKCYWKV